MIVIGISGSSPCRDDPSLVSVVLLVGNQEAYPGDLRKRVRQSARKFAGVHGDCHSFSHSAVVRAAAPQQALDV